VSGALDGVVEILARHLPRLYAVVDPAREPQVLEWLGGSGLPFQCLFQGEKAKSLAEEAPYLLHFGNDVDALRSLVEAHHDSATVIYLVSDAPFYAVRRHLRRIQIVRTEDDQSVFFRYYDPRVARVFLPTCDDEQIRWMFGDVVERWLCETEEEAHLLEMQVTRDEPEGASRVRYDQVG